MFKSLAVAAIVLVSAQLAAPKADAVTLNIHGGLVNNEIPFYTDSITFSLPAGFTNPIFTITNYRADDSSVVFLNGVEFSNTGIWNPPNASGNGNFSFTGNLTSAPAHTFINSNNSLSFATLPVDLASLLTVGENTLFFYVNNTREGIGLATSPGGPSDYNFDATLTFDAAAVPGPVVGAGLPGLMIAVAGLVMLSRRRRDQSRAA